MLCRWLNSKFNKIQSAAGEWKSKTFQVMENRMKIWQALGRETCTPISGIILLRRMLISKKRERFLRTKWDESRRIVDLVSTLYAAASTNGDKKIRRTCPVLPISELVAFLRFQFQTFGQTYESKDFLWITASSADSAGTASPSDNDIATMHRMNRRIDRWLYAAAKFDNRHVCVDSDQP